MSSLNSEPSIGKLTPFQESINIESCGIEKLELSPLKTQSKSVRKATYTTIDLAPENNTAKIKSIIDSLKIENYHLKWLNPHQDLNDLIINFYIEYLNFYNKDNEEFKDKVMIMETYWYPILKRKNTIQEYNRLIK